MKALFAEKTLLLLGLLGAVFSSSMAMANDEAAKKEVDAVPAIAWALRVPEQGAVTFHGLGNFDEAGLAQGQMMYPAPNAVGLLAAVLTHALIVDSSRRSQINKLQEEADKVLNPYRHILDKLDSRDLMARALAVTTHAGSGKLIDTPSHSGTEIMVESVPLFSMTQDQSAILVDNLLAIQKPGSSPDSAYRNTIRVVLAASGASNPVEHWTANDGEKLKEASSRLLAQSIDIAFADANAAPTDDKPYRTIRYPEGGSEKIERAQIIEARCGRLLIRTLRGTLMSVPASKTTPVAKEESCGPIAALGK